MTLSDHNGLLSDYKYYFYNVLKYVTILIGAATPSRANFSDLICNVTKFPKGILIIYIIGVVHILMRNHIYAVTGTWIFCKCFVHVNHLNLLAQILENPYQITNNLTSV